MPGSQSYSSAHNTLVLKFGKADFARRTAKGRRGQATEEGDSFYFLPFLFSPLLPSVRNFWQGNMRTHKKQAPIRRDQRLLPRRRMNETNIGIDPAHRPFVQRKTKILLQYPER
jgi:hypothetical protein